MRSSVGLVAVPLASACTSGYSSGVEGGKPLSTLAGEIAKRFRERD